MKKITIDGLTYICFVSYADNVEHLTCSDAEKIAGHLEKNGAVILKIDSSDVPEHVYIKHNVYKFMGETYFLTQCEGNIFEWVKQTAKGDFTYYFDMVVFHTENGIIAAHKDNITNTVKI